LASSLTGKRGRERSTALASAKVKLSLTLFQRAVPSVTVVMGSYPALLAAVALLGATGPVAPAPAQDVAAPCRLCSPAEGSAGEAPAEPVQLTVEARLDFDQLILAGSGEGSAELLPDGARIARGSVTAISARAMAGEVSIRGEPGRQVRIELPGTIELIGFNGGSIRLESIRSDLPPLPKLDSNGRLSFRFGGIVRVSGDTDGEFRGDVRVNVEYF
jgi:hypothetical protein